MRLLRRIANATRLTELIGTAEVQRAEEYAQKGWVVVRRTRMLNIGESDGHQTVYAQITDSGRQVLRGGST